MINVYVRGRMADLASLQAASLRRQYAFHFLGYATTGATSLRLLETPDLPAFMANRHEGVTVCTFRSEEIGAYVGLARADYLLLLSVLGLVQHHALKRNPLFREEDFMHGEPANCLFSYRDTLAEYIQLLEEPEICPYCKHFYGALCDSSVLGALGTEVNWCRDSIKKRWDTVVRER